MNWKTILTTLCSLIVATYLVFALFALSKPTDDKVCRELRVNIEQSTLAGFLTPADVRNMLITDHLSPEGHAIDKIDLAGIEDALEDKELIENAECYTIHDSIVVVEVKQRVPVARVINNRGEDYYIDTHGLPMPHGPYFHNLVVATGHITPSYAEQHLAPLANEVMENSFWRDGIVQFNVLNDGSIELIPRVGDHVVYLGQPLNIGKKLDRLRKFYLYGLNVAGWNKYSYINVEFDNQIICKRRQTAQRR